MTKPVIYRWPYPFFGVLLLFMHTLAAAEPPPSERIQWDRVPIRLNLSVGRERMVHFPAPVTLGLPASLQSRVRVQSVNDTVYLLAHQAFEPVRILVREIRSGWVYLFDLAATEDEFERPPLEIVAATQPAEVASENQEQEPTRPYGYVGLTRFAAQHLYAPARLLGPHPGIVRVPVKRDPVDLYRGGAIEASPLVAWRSGSLFVTALRLLNRTNEPQILDPRNLRGRWLTATFQHNRLLPAGDEADRTAVYLVSERPFAASL